MTELDFNGGGHVNPDMDRMHVALGGGKDEREVSSTTIEFPVDLLLFIDLYALERGISRRDLTRTILEEWAEKHVPNVKHVQTHGVPIAPPLDRRSGRGDDVVDVETKLVTLYMIPACHRRLKQVSLIIRATLRGVLLGIFYDWQDKQGS